MIKGLAFWILMLAWLALGVYNAWPHFAPLGSNLLLFILFLLLG